MPILIDQLLQNRDSRRRDNCAAEVFGIKFCSLRIGDDFKLHRFRNVVLEASATTKIDTKKILTGKQSHML